MKSGRWTRGLEVSLLIGAIAGGAWADQTIYKFYGDAGGDRLGFHVAKAGDVDNDGFVDVIAGAPLSDVPFSDAGLARIYSGKTGAVLYTFQGTQTSDFLGWQVDGVGDVNHDGHDDVVIGVPQLSSGNGRAEVRSGSDGSLLWTVVGVAPGDNVGVGVAGAGDITGDGTPEVLVAAGHNGNPLPGADVTMYDGGTGLPYWQVQFAPYNTWVSLETLGDVIGDGVPDIGLGVPAHDSVAVLSGLGGPLYVLTGPDDYGTSIGRAGDLDADGYADFYVGAPGAGGGAGRVDAVSGIKASILYTIEGAGRLGSGVDAVDDIDGDGVRDLVAGMPKSDCNGADAGSVRTHSGVDGFLLYEEFGTPGDELGTSVASIGDIDGDGAIDVVSGAPDSSWNAPQDGAVWVSTVVNPYLEHYGAGCPGSGGYVPELHLTGNSEPGDRLRFAIEKGLGGSVAILLFGLGKTDVPLGGGCSLLVDPLVGISSLLPLSAGGAGDGEVVLCQDIPGNQVPGTITLQAIIADPASALGFSMTNGGRMTIP